VTTDPGRGDNASVRVRRLDQQPHLVGNRLELRWRKPDAAWRRPMDLTIYTVMKDVGPEVESHDFH